MFDILSKEKFTERFINESFKDLAIIESQKDTRAIAIFFEPKSYYGYINDLNGNYYKFSPKKKTVLATISEIFNINKKNIMITTCKPKKETKNKSLKIKDCNWKTIIDNMEFVNISFMHF
jgi:hypothetical protein